MRNLIFVDTETGGLDAECDPLVELTWAREHDEPKTLWFGVQEVSPFIDDLIKFTERGIAGRRSTQPEIEEFLKASQDNTMVAANPAFDKAFIEAAGLWRFHYRTLDIESFAYAKVPEFNDVPSMKNIYDYLVAQGHKLTKPDHTSRNDVLAMREAFDILESM